MKQPEFRVIKCSGTHQDYYYLEERGWLWGWNRIPRHTYYEHSEYEFYTREDCEQRVKEILRSRNPDKVVMEIHTNTQPVTFLKLES